MENSKKIPDIDAQLYRALKKIPWEIKKVKLYLWLLKKINFFRR
ncbi:MAG: hypothetical protein ACRCWN_02725 [Fusobacteriaceae bacterium]